MTDRTAQATRRSHGTLAAKILAFIERHPDARNITVADALNCRAEYVSVVRQRNGLLRGTSPRAKRPAETNARTIVVPNDILDRLEPYAQKRRVSVNELVRTLVGTAAEEGLIDAILDDATDEAPHA